MCILTVEDFYTKYKGVIGWKIIIFYQDCISSSWKNCRESFSKKKVKTESYVHVKTQRFDRRLYTLEKSLVLLNCVTRRKKSKL